MNNFFQKLNLSAPLNVLPAYIIRNKFFQNIQRNGTILQNHPVKLLQIEFWTKCLLHFFPQFKHFLHANFIGTGLGLSVAFDIVKAHGDELNAGTKEGEGSEFIIRLPIMVT